MTGGVSYVIIRKEDMLNADRIKERARQLGADTVGITRPAAVDNPDRFIRWLVKGMHGEMTYLSRHLETRLDPNRILPDAKSIIVVGLNYFQDNDGTISDKGKYKVARYAWGVDYHRTIRKLLKRLRQELRSKAPELKGRICVDTAPFMDKYWAEKAGLGWQGKHTNLVSRQWGNWLLLGSLILNHEIDKYDAPETDHCGNCRACVDACPTGALFTEYNLDATRCISYWTIESKSEEIPDSISINLNGWVFGCDICISVCPFNKFQKPFSDRSFAKLEGVGLVENGAVVTVPESGFSANFAQSPLSRAGLKGIRRNIRAAEQTS